jgi:hypothetical protein
VKKGKELLCKLAAAGLLIGAGVAIATTGEPLLIGAAGAGGFALARFLG